MESLTSFLILDQSFAFSCLDLSCKIQENGIHINIYFKLNLGSGISGNYLKLYAEVCK